MNTEAKNTNDAVNQVIATRIQEIKNLVGLGWTKEAAIEYVRGSSTLGAKSWEAVLAGA